MNKHSKVILHYVFLVTGCIALGWLLGKLTTYMAIWAIQTWGTAFLALAAKVTMLVVVAESYKGRNEWANSLFRCPLELTVGDVKHFPAGMRPFDTL